jgi:gluconate 2-dehydrogenase gamma chain
MSDKNNSPDGTPSGSGIGRRPFLLGSLASLGAVAIGMHFLPRGSLGGDSPAARVEIDLANYQPSAFDATEWRFLLAACDRLIPSDGAGPGALDTNVPVFIDRQLLTPYGKGQDWYMDGPHDPHASKLFGYQMPFDLHTLYRKGIAATDRYTNKTLGHAFADLAPAQQDAVIAALEQNAIDFAQVGEPDLNAAYFFTRLLENTKEGYLADPQYGGNKGMAAWVMINFPGARASFSDWIARHDEVYPLKPVALDGTQA